MAPSSVRGIPARRTPLRQPYHDGARLQSWVQCVRVCSGPESCCKRPAWLGVRAKLGPSVNPVVDVGVAGCGDSSGTDDITRESRSRSGIIGYGGSRRAVSGRRDAHLSEGSAADLLAFATYLRRKRRRQFREVRIFFLPSSLCVINSWRISYKAQK